MGERMAAWRVKWMARGTLGALVLGALVLGTGGTGLPVEAQSVSVPNLSGNWAGYVAPGSGITQVTGEWTVPPIGAVPGASATWVGIGGYSTSDLIQTGTQQVGAPLNAIAGGSSYAAWFELLPNAPTYLFGVSPGDHMQASVTDLGGTCSGSPDAGTAGTTTSNWSIVITDVSTGRSQPETVCYSSSQSSAEWIHEAPSVAVVPIPVGGPVTVTFDGNNTATGTFASGGASGDIAATRAVPVIALPLETAVSSLDSDGNGFSVCTYALTCSPPAS